MNDKKIDIDQLFNSRLSEAEEAFDPNAWEQMQQKLNENDNRKGGAILLPNKSTKIKTITIMTTLIASVVAISLYNYSPLQNTETTNSIQTNTTPDSYRDAKANPTKSTTQNTANYNSTSKASNTPKNIYNTYVAPVKKSVSKTPVIEKTAKQQTKEFINTIEAIPAYKLSFNGKLEEEQTNPDSAKIAKFILGNKKYRYDKPWIGIHLTGMLPLGMMQDSGYRPGLGFNIELMSGDILKAKYMGLSLGGSMGVLWNGFSKKQEVILATPNNDRGYTRLYNMGFHLDFIARAEFGNYRLKPYVDGVLGIRNVSTFQTVNSDQSIQGFQQSTSTLSTSWALQYGVSAGLRWHWVPGVSVDLRGTLYSGSNLNFIDVKHTPYNANTATYSPQLRTAPSDMFVIRLGLLFDLDEMSYTQKEHYHTNSYQQTNANQTPIYNNTSGGNTSGSSSTSGNNSGRIGGGGGMGSSGGGAPLKIKVPSPAPVRK